MLELFDGIICYDDKSYGEGNDELYDSVMGFRKIRKKWIK